MWFAVECYFDSTTETGIRKLWADLAAAQINSRMLEVNARPHIQNQFPSLKDFTTDWRDLRRVMRKVEETLRDEYQLIPLK
jgi:hypothetical protein